MGTRGTGGLGRSGISAAGERWTEGKDLGVQTVDERAEWEGGREAEMETLASEVEGSEPQIGSGCWRTPDWKGLWRQREKGKDEGLGRGEGAGREGGKLLEVDERMEYGPPQTAAGGVFVAQRPPRCGTVACAEGQWTGTPSASEAS